MCNKQEYEAGMILRFGNMMLYLRVMYRDNLMHANPFIEPSIWGGVLINALVLPTDVVLNLACENVGIADETGVLDDPENPFTTTTILEFNPNNPGARTSPPCSVRSPRARPGRKPVSACLQRHSREGSRVRTSSAPR